MRAKMANFFSNKTDHLRTITVMAEHIWVKIFQTDGLERTIENPARP